MEHDLSPAQWSLLQELWGGCAWINLDDGASPLRECIEPFASKHDEWKVGALRTEWWKS